MFEVKVMVEEKKLSQLLWALDGVVVGAPQIIPVRNAAVRVEKGTSVVTEKVPTNGEILPLRLARRILESKQPIVRRNDVIRMIKDLGGGEGSINYALNYLFNKKMLVRVGASQYRVNPPKENAHG